MPFITKEERDRINLLGFIKDFSNEVPGNICYYYYKPMVEAWKKEPRWTTAHNIYKKVQECGWDLDDDQHAAYNLAWQVFFNLYVMPYELKKREENGDI